MASRTGLTVEQLLHNIQAKTQQMEENQRLGNYAEAEKIRLAIEQTKKDYEGRKLFELEQKHRNEINEWREAHEEEIEHFQKYWQKTMSELIQEGQRFEKEIEERQQEEFVFYREDYEKQISLKFKESSELLNLRKMKEHMAKQKKEIISQLSFVEAQKIKDRCEQLERQEKEQYENSRNLKIETGLNKIRRKQESEINAFHKKIKTSIDDKNKERVTEENRLRQKYININKDLRMQQEKEIMAYKGQLKNVGGTSSPLINKRKTGLK